MTTPSTGNRRVDARRAIAAAVLVAALIALAAMAFASNRSVRSITEVRPARSRVANVRPFPPASDSGTLTAQPPRGLARIPDPPAAPHAPALPPSNPLPPPAPPPPLEPSGHVYEDCAALGLPAPSKTAGLAAIVPLVPLFGPFAAEGFALMPAFEPGVDFFGPFMPELEAALGDLAPALEALTPGVATLGQAGFDAIAPVYGPQRPAFLDAEADLATAIAPLVSSLAVAPGTECAVALQGVLADALADRPNLPTQH